MLLLSATSPRAAGAAPLEVYGRLPFIEQAALSPDGLRVAFAVTDGETRKIIVKRLDTGAIVNGLNAGVQKIRGIQWAGANHLLITGGVTDYIPFVDTPRAEWSLAVDYNLTKNTQRVLNSNLDESVGDALNVIEDIPQVRILDGHPFAFVTGTVFDAGQGQLALIKVDLDHDDLAHKVFGGLKNTTGYLVDAHGKPLAMTEYDGAKKVWTLRVWKGSAWHVVKREDAPIDQPALAGLGRDGASIALILPGGTDGVMRELSPDGETWTEPVPAPDGLIWDPATEKLIGQSFLTGDESRVEFFDATDAKTWRALAGAYPGDRVNLVSSSADHRKFILKVDSVTEGPAFAFVDLDTRKGDWIGEEYQGLTSQDVSPVKPVSFKANDGLALTGYLTLPKGKPAKALPLVVFPHGGPAARDEPGFDWWAQAMASRGYAVLQVNYRGSEGFGWAFQSAGFGQWGRKMQTDLSDGVRYLAAEGVIDPARVCIVGASYGGYAALAGVTLDPGVYRCAASLAGPSDLGKMLSSVRFDGGDAARAVERYWLRYMGPSSELRSISPAYQAAKVTVPVLLIHGKDDTVVPYEQSQAMADALHKAGRPVEFVTLRKEDHWLSRGETRLQMLQAVTAFLEKNNPPN